MKNKFKPDWRLHPRANVLEKIINHAFPDANDLMSALLERMILQRTPLTKNVAGVLGHLMPHCHSAKFWRNLQKNYDKAKGKNIKDIG